MTKMHIALLYIELHLPQAQSLKQKRSVIKSLKDKLHHQFNVSVAEVDFLDKWQRAALAIVMVSNDSVHLESSGESITRFIQIHLGSGAYITAREFSFL